jgi:hypothetical protein
MARDKPSEDFVEQKITQQITIVAGNTGRVEIDIPREKEVFLKGYGYSWFTANYFNLSTGNMSFPRRSDQEGSPAIPVIFGTPFKCRSGGKLRLSITNGDSADHTYDVVFYVITNELLDVESTGGDLNLTIGGSAGAASSVAITNSTGSAFADVTANGLEVYLGTAIPAGTNNIGDVDIASALPAGTNNIGTVGAARTAAHTAPVIGSSSTAALAAAATRKAALFVNDSDETIYLNIGGTAAANTGIRLNANGGSYEMSQELGNLSTAAITAICASGSKTLLVTQWV